MKYETLDKKGKTIYQLAAFIALIITVSVLYFCKAGVNGALVDGWFTKYFLKSEPVSNILYAALTLLSSLLILAVSSTMTRIKISFIEYIAGISAITGICLFSDVTICGSICYICALLLFWIYMREVPFDCLGTKEPVPCAELFVIILGIICGYSGFSISIALISFSIFVTGYIKKVGHEVYPFHVLGTVALIVGTILKIVFPGFLDKDFKNLSEYYSNNAAYIANAKQLISIAITSMVVLVAAIIVSYALKRVICNTGMHIEEKYTVIAAAFSFVALLVPSEDKMSVGFVIFLLLTVVSAVLQRVFEKKSILRAYTYGLCAIVWVFGIIKLLAASNILGL